MNNIWTFTGEKKHTKIKKKSEKIAFFFASQEKNKTSGLDWFNDQPTLSGWKKYVIFGYTYLRYTYQLISLPSPPEIYVGL